MDESRHLLEIHNDLMARLKAKQENIEDLLQQADRVVDEQSAADRPVYEAMVGLGRFYSRSISHDLVREVS